VHHRALAALFEIISVHLSLRSWLRISSILAGSMRPRPPPSPLCPAQTLRAGHRQGQPWQIVMTGSARLAEFFN